jgi:putative ABC transport system permease protein
MVVRQGLLLTAVRTTIGLVGAYGLGRSLSGLLFGVAPSDPLVIGAGAALLWLTAIVACLVPAYRAMRVDPAVALQCE